MDLKEKAALFAIVSVSTLAIGKIIAGSLSGSMAIISSGLDNVLDAVISGMNLIAIRFASRPADTDHHYGHGKAEDLATVVESIIILLSGVALIYKTLERFLKHQNIRYSGIDVGIMVLSLLFSFVISVVLKKVAEKTDSSALKADSLHYTSDIYTNIAVIIAIMATHYTGRVLFDFSLAIIVGLIIIYSTLKIFKNGVSALMDARITKKIEEQVEEIIQRTPFPYAGFHKLRSRSSGSSKYVDFHVLICRKTSLDEAHSLVNTLEERIKKEIKGMDAMVHMEPCEYTCDLTEETCVVLKMKKRG